MKNFLFERTFIKRRGIILITFAVGLVAVCSPALAVSCFTVNSFGDYVMNSSVDCHSPIYISASDVVFDCQGNTISSDAQWAVAIGMDDFTDYSSLSDVTIQNCDIENVNAVGVYVNPNAYSKFFNISVVNSTLDGGSSDYSLFSNYVGGLALVGDTLSNGFNIVLTNGFTAVNDTVQDRVSEDMPAIVQFSDGAVIANSTFDSLELDGVWNYSVSNNYFDSLSLGGAHGISSNGYPADLGVSVDGNYWTDDYGAGYSDTCFSLFTDHCWFGYAFDSDNGGVDQYPLSVRPF